MGLATAKRFAKEGMDHVFITGLRKKTIGRCSCWDWKGRNSRARGDAANLSDLNRSSYVDARLCAV